MLVGMGGIFDMSEALTRDTVELIALSFHDDGMSYEQRQAMQRLVDSDDALRAQLQAQTERAENILEDVDSLRAACHAFESQVDDLTAKLEARTQEWDKWVEQRTFLEQRLDRTR